MAREQKPFGGAPRLGNGAPGEPLPSPSTDGIGDGFSGAPTIVGDRNLDRGAAQVGRSGGGEVTPAGYGGAPTFQPRRPAPGASGSGDGTGAGATSGNSVP